ncbi:MAG: hypothetical protein V7761_05135 [Amylibacter sp.]
MKLRATIKTNECLPQSRAFVFSGLFVSATDILGEWLTIYQKRMSNLLEDDLSIEDKKEILIKFIEKTTVESIDNQQHKLTIHFKKPLVDDSLVYKNPSKRSEGYQIADGIKDLILDIDTVKCN